MTSNQKTMNIILWIAQVLLAFIFIWLGFMKIFQPEQLPFPWVRDSRNLALLTGLVDLLGGLGIVLPTLLRIQPKLIIFAAYGIIILMMLQVFFIFQEVKQKTLGLTFLSLYWLYLLLGADKQKHR